MILGKRNKGARQALKELQDEMGFKFVDGLILPAEQEALLKRIYMRNAKSNNLSKEEKDKLSKEAAELVKKIADRLRIENKEESIGSISEFVQSEGGAALEKNTFTEYAAIKINDKIVILEPIGQANNATFIARYNEEKKEELEENIQKFGRKTAVKKGILSKVTHETKQAGRYDCEGKHILELIDYAVERPDELLDNLDRLMKTQESCTLRTLGKMMDGKAIVDNMRKSIAEQVQNRGIKGFNFDLQLFNNNLKRDEGGFER